MRIIFSLMIVSSILICQDWANLNRYHSENEKLGKPLIHEDRIVFMGNSITEIWSSIQPEFFNNRPYINRGISGQTTPQMLIRFRPDVFYYPIILEYKMSPPIQTHVGMTRTAELILRDT